LCDVEISHLDFIINPNFKITSTSGSLLNCNWIVTKSSLEIFIGFELAVSFNNELDSNYNFLQSSSTLVANEISLSNLSSTYSDRKMGSENSDVVCYDKILRKASFGFI